MNAKRSLDAQEAISRTRCDDAFTALGDLLCSIAHYCDRRGFDLGERLIHAEFHYAAETNYRGKQFLGVLDGLVSRRKGTV